MSNKDDNATESQFSPMAMTLIPPIGGFSIGLLIVFIMRSILQIEVDDRWIILPSMGITTLVMWTLVILDKNGKMDKIKKDNKNGGSEINES
jgi:ABC-type protease/lipase transport system fused ATPase/permease subunit